jgi:hypothetical protein
MPKRITIKIRVITCSDSLFWYANHIGKVFTTINETAEDYLVREPSGYTNIILKKDCEEVSNDGE